MKSISLKNLALIKKYNNPQNKQEEDKDRSLNIA